MSGELPDGLRLRAASDADLPAVRGLIDRAGVPADEPDPRAGALFVAEAGDALLGVVGLREFGEDALLQTPCVDPDWRGRGIGRALVEHALTEAALAAIGTVHLLASGTERFFARFGFVEESSADLPLPVARLMARSRAATPNATPMRLKLSDG